MFRIFLFSCASLLLLASCTQTPAPEAATTAPAPAATPAPAGTAYAVTAANSTVLWKGTKPTGFHEGAVALKEGKLYVNQGVVSGGSFVLDMNAITCTDIPDAGENKDLVDHLKDGDFFDVANHPTATFEITAIAPLTGQAGATHTVTGNLTLRGKTNAISFPATLAVSETEVTATAANVAIDRTKWGITYKSATLASVIKDKAISDQITLQIRLKAVK